MPWTSWAQFILRFLGNPFGGTPGTIALVGGLALLAGAVAGWRAVRHVSMTLGHALRSDYLVHAALARAAGAWGDR